MISRIANTIRARLRLNMHKFDIVFVSTHKHISTHRTQGSRLEYNHTTTPTHSDPRTSSDLHLNLHSHMHALATNAHAHAHTPTHTHADGLATTCTCALAPMHTCAHMGGRAHAPCTHTYTCANAFLTYAHHARLEDRAVSQQFRYLGAI